MKAVNEALRLSRRVITILWHNCSLKMIGGRMCDKVLEVLASMDHTKIVRGVDYLKRSVLDGFDKKYSLTLC